jgi:hypothetical protein
MMFVAFFIAKSSLQCQKSQKETLSFHSKAERPLSMMKEPHPHRFKVT